MGTNFPFFDGLDEEDQRRVRQRCNRNKYAPGAFVFHQGEAGATLHMIESGKVAVLAGLGLHEPIMLTIMRAGEAFGDQALLSPDDRRTATIQAITHTETLSLHRDDFEDLRRRIPAVDRLLIAVLAARVDRLTHQLVEYADVPAPTRIYRRLVQLAEIFELCDSSRPIPVTQNQLAALAGVKLRMTNQVIGKARADGVVDTAKRRISILDWIELRRRAGLAAA